MRFLYYTAPSPAEDLALEEALHTFVEERLSPNTWRVWQARVPAVILGTGQEAKNEANLEAASTEGVPVLRRHSGGGCVVIGPGVINFSAFYAFADLPGSETIRGATSAALQPVIQLLARWGLRAQEAGLSDLAVQAADAGLQKIAGNSQARKHRSVLVHGTLLADPEWNRMERLLRFPTKTPEYRAGREHRAFLTSLKENGAPHSLQAFAEGLSAVLQSSSDIVWAHSPSEEESFRATKLLKEKYSRDEWNLRR